MTAQSQLAAEMESPARVERIATAVTQAFANSSIRTLVDIRNAVVVAVLADRRRQSGWTPVQTHLAERADVLLQVLGPSVLIGLSADHPSTSYLPRALHEANIALEFARPDQRILRFSSLPLRELLVHRGADYVQAAMPQWAAALLAANEKANGSLLETLRAVAAADLNVQKAGRNLGKHPNTLYARLERIKGLTGLDGQRYRDLTELLLAADCWRM